MFLTGSWAVSSRILSRTRMFSSPVPSGFCVFCAGEEEPCCAERKIENGTKQTLGKHLFMLCCLLCGILFLFLHNAFNFEILLFITQGTFHLAPPIKSHINITSDHAEPQSPLRDRLRERPIEDNYSRHDSCCHGLTSAFKKTRSKFRGWFGLHHWLFIVLQCWNKSTVN